MSELISGKEAKLAWGKGEAVLYRSRDKVWRNLNDTDFYSSIFENKLYEFRLKPRTITLNGVEVPAPFEPKEGDVYFIINPYCNCGYSEERHSMEYVGLGAWRTEEEVKQVVAALRSVFKA